MTRERRDEDASPIIPAATVVVLRDHADGGVEALMLRRNAKLEFAGGMWVFPGGRVDDGDRAGLAVDDAEGAARRAAVRESAEEAGVELDPDALVWFSHWTPPPIAPKRFGTYFFATAAPAADVVVTIDGGEIHDHAWMRPREAMARRDAQEIQLGPPTWITLAELARHETVDAALDAFRQRPAEHFATRIASIGDRLIALYDGDVAYDGGDPDADGGRHRLSMADDGWRYERDGWGS
ncbi:NUDIX hydrolase [Aquihabitans sp. McL0605]|uniref:NUDIX hydrolase n=1 Tax=Aquihabitans sp. McL0605 TaxID=3415671 RepID=UPI003CEC3AFF